MVGNRSKQHTRIINNTSDHIQRLNIEFSKEGVTKFLLSTRFLFQNLDRVEFYDLNFDLLGDTDTLDLVQDAFVKSDNVEESKIGNNDDQDINLDKTPKTKQKISFNTKSYVRKYYEENETQLLSIFFGLVLFSIPLIWKANSISQVSPVLSQDFISITPS